MTTLPGLFLLASLNFHLPPNLLESVCFVESKHQVSAYNKNDKGSPSYGVCQIKYSTAKMLGFTGSPAELQNPKINVYYAAKYLSHLQTRYHSNISKMIISYNRGSAKKLTHTRYSDKVYSAWEEFNNERRYYATNWGF